MEVPTEIASGHLPFVVCVEAYRDKNEHDYNILVAQYQWFVTTFSNKVLDLVGAKKYKTDLSDVIIYREFVPGVHIALKLVYKTVIIENENAGRWLLEHVNKCIDGFVSFVPSVECADAVHKASKWNDPEYLATYEKLMFVDVYDITHDLGNVVGYASIFLDTCKMKSRELGYVHAVKQAINSRSKIDVICPWHGIVPTTPNRHLSNKIGCSLCGRPDWVAYFELWKKIAHRRHWNKYGYEFAIYNGKRAPMRITCPIPGHGEFMQAPDDHMHNNGCKKCGGTAPITLSEFIERATALHGSKYSYSLTEYVSREVKVEIICLVGNHGVFWQEAHNHLAGHGCPMCAYKTPIGASDWVNRMIVLHDHIYDYSKTIYENHKNHVTIRCKKHDEYFRERPYRHEAGFGCPKCQKCSSCGIGRKTIGDLCSDCGGTKKSRELVGRNKKEMVVVKFIQEKLPTVDFIYDRTIGNMFGEGHIRPDIRFDCGFYQLIIEVDENQHRGYQCEKARMYNIAMRLMMPCIFVRYNPDRHDSDLNMLLEVVQRYLYLKEEDPKPWDDYGFAVEYLFYTFDF